MDITTGYLKSLGILHEKRGLPTLWRPLGGSMHMVRSTITFFLFIILFKVHLANGSDVSKTILGLQLGMTLEEVRGRYPSLEVRMVKHWGSDDILFYTATVPPEKINNWVVASMLFSPYKQGRKLYKLQVEQFVGDHVYKELEQKVIDRFGPPDCVPPDESGKSLFWGGCPGKSGDERGKAKSGYLSFIYENAHVTLIMEDQSISESIKYQVIKHDEETRIREVLQLDF